MTPIEEDRIADFDRECTRQTASIDFLNAKFYTIKEALAEEMRSNAAAFDSLSVALSKQAQANEAIADAIVILAECCKLARRDVKGKVVG